MKTVTQASIEAIVIKASKGQEFGDLLCKMMHKGFTAFGPSSTKDGLVSQAMINVTK